MLDAFTICIWGGLSIDSLRVRSHTSYSGGQALLGFDRVEISLSVQSLVAQHVFTNAIFVLLNSAGGFLPCEFWCRASVSCYTVWCCWWGIEEKLIMFISLFTRKNVTILILCFNFSFFSFYVLKFCISKAGSLSLRTLKHVFLIAFSFNVKEWNGGGKTNLSWRKFSVISGFSVQPTREDLELNWLGTVILCLE